jgi:hypothetical protein
MCLFKRKDLQRMLDQLRPDITTRLDELLGEADKLRQALTALGTRQRNGASSTAASSSPLGVTRISREPRFGDGGSWPLPGTRQDDLHGKLTGAHVAVGQGEDRLADLVAHGARGDQGRHISRA